MPVPIPLIIALLAAGGAGTTIGAQLSGAKLEREKRKHGARGAYAAKRADAVLAEEEALTQQTERLPADLGGDEGTWNWVQALTQGLSPVVSAGASGGMAAGAEGASGYGAAEGGMDAEGGVTDDGMARLLAAASGAQSEQGSSTQLQAALAMAAGDPRFSERLLAASREPERAAPLLSLLGLPISRLTA